MKASQVIPGKLVEHMETNGGTLTFSCTPTQDQDQWVAGYHFGREAEDSPMAAGAAYGMGETFQDAFAGIMTDLWPSADDKG